MAADINFQDVKILIIDDQADARGMLRAMLAELGVTQVYEASDGREGLSFIDVAPDMVDLLICDWNMPRMSGIDLLRQLRSVFSNIPFLMVTGRKDIDSIAAAKSSGVTAYIGKPFSKAQLEVKLRVILNRRDDAKK
jgi:two-component system chemotaxis response regulator CheY